MSIIENNIIELPATEFSIKTLIDIYDKESFVYDKETKKYTPNRNLSNSIKYVNSYIFQCVSSNYCFYDAYTKSLKYYNIDELNKLYFNKVEPKLKKQITSSFVDIYNTVSDNTKELLYKEDGRYYINIGYINYCNHFIFVFNTNKSIDDTRLLFQTHLLK